MLYDYFKVQFLQKTKIYGHKRLVYEKEVLRNVSENTLRNCLEKNGEKDCEYLVKDELSFIEEIRETQTNKSVQIILNKILKEVRTMKLNESKIQKTIKELQLQIYEYFTTMQRKKHKTDLDYEAQKMLRKAYL